MNNTSLPVASDSGEQLPTSIDPSSRDIVSADDGHAVRLLDRLADQVWYFSSDIGGDRPEVLARNAVRFGVLSILCFFGFFGLWASFAPINSAAIAMGKVILDSNKKTIQHLEGGIVASIQVKEGQTVKAGDTLILLDETTAKAQYELLRKQYVTALATEARLLAERDKKKEITFPEELLSGEHDEAVVRESLDSQQRLFISRRGNIEGQVSILGKKIQQFKEEIQGLGSQSVSASEQITLLEAEIQDVQTLVNSKNAPRSRLLALQRQLESLKGMRGEYGATVARARQSIGEAEIAILNANNDFMNKVNEELKETQSSLADLEERLRASKNTFTRITITSPISGIVVDMQVHTVGGIIRPGDKIMNIVPTDDPLIVEALVSPQDIDVVREGLDANVRLTAFKSREVPPVHGKVTQVSADRFDDPNTGAAFYKARVVVDKDELAALGKDIEMYPGMPADVLIVTGERTLVSYMFAPIRESFSKSFREH
ncbi:MAG: HlyD family type I secretion periplasmic adaptor subunit [Alphaproteobacteria bacterium]|nr:MAG: HlyD family type I secretion periplasmic adaptor subunit [Alphaproteobacteria bacterium]